MRTGEVATRANPVVARPQHNDASNRLARGTRSAIMRCMVDRAPRATDTDGLLLGDLLPGTRIGQYVIEHKLPTRGTGHVYAAVHVVLPRRVTIKVMPAANAWSREVALELLREACIVDALDHPGIPRVYECGMLADRRPWTATELVDGPTLAMSLQCRSVSALEAAAIVRDVAEILDYTHGRGLVHRNVTPTAIIFPQPTRRFPLCLADWSGARAHDSTSPIPMRTTAYTAPEQHADQSVDGRTDIYSLGMIAHELLQRACPGTAPPVFAALVQRMVSPHPAHRPIAREVRDHATWLADQIDPDFAIPEAIDDEPTAPMDSVPRVITSEITPNISGEIRQR